MGIVLHILRVWSVCDCLTWDLEFDPRWCRVGKSHHDFVWTKLDDRVALFYRELKYNLFNC